ncbi:MAG: signal recognition particle-docking protein FtsY [Chloroflexi bacterium]|nr:signal recognition particle-docking protein FtsY [Chloroflexota bacterium]
MRLGRLRRPMAASVDAGAAPTRRRFGGGLRRWFDRGGLDDADWEELEELLIQADLGPELSLELVEGLRDAVQDAGIKDPEAARALLCERLTAELGGPERAFAAGEPPQVVLVVGVNGAGKTTSIAKLGTLLQSHSYSVLLAAADTYRAGAIDQLRIWGERIEAPVVAHQPGSDPGAVVYDALDAAKARGVDYVIADTAGRQHTNLNLMNELAKVRRVAERQVPGAPHEVLLVLDALTGQNGLRQAQAFRDAVDVTGVIVSKLDSSAKGGVAFAVTRALGVPIKFIGTGERTEDFAVFEPEEFAAAVLAGDDDTERGA